MNDEPIRLKPEDSPAPPDPQCVGIELMELLRSMADDTLHLRALLTGWGDNPIAVQRKAQTRVVEVAETAARALDRGETLMQSLRAARLFSAAYSDDLGVRGGR